MTNKIVELVVPTLTQIVASWVVTQVAPKHSILEAETWEGPSVGVELERIIAWVIIAAAVFLNVPVTYI